MTKQIVQTIVWNRKKDKEHAKMMRLAAKELARMSTPAPMTPAERRGMRADQQRQRRANKALLSVVL
jgi:hypothetical protein